MISTYVLTFFFSSLLQVSSLTVVHQEDLNPETTKQVLNEFASGSKPKPGPLSGRHTSENSAGLTALTAKVSDYFLEFLSTAKHDNSHMVLASIVHLNSSRLCPYGI
jgi:hypothetical protein